MANFTLTPDGERTIALKNGETFKISIDTRPWGKFEEIISAYQDQSEALRRKRDELLIAEAKKRNIELHAELDKRTGEERNGNKSLSQAKLELAVEWSVALLGEYELLKKRFARELCKWGIANHSEIIINGSTELPFIQEERLYEGISYKIVADETLDAYSKLGILEPMAEEIYNTLFPTEDEKKT
ncbi:MAG: hypothetical protein Kow0090_08700 [Myxococcota bacterium]